MMIKNLICLIILIITFGCSGEDMKKDKIYYQLYENVPISAWNEFGKCKIIFGHQSVGENIIDGVRDIIHDRSDIKLNIVGTENNDDTKTGGIAHFKIGENTKPLTKINEFSDIVNNAWGGKADVALFKFCYVDFNKNTNVDSIFKQYQDTITRLKNKYPDMVFIHATVPLVEMQKGLKAWIKKIIGRSDDNAESNMIRNQYNDLLRQSYFNNEPVFDIAELESTYPDGRRESFVVNGKEYFALAPVYTDDGGHLNQIGRKHIAEQFLLVLINSCGKSVKQ